jgi:hypothetical protein
MIAHKTKKQTDIGSFPVKKLDPIKENVSLNDWDMKKTTRVAIIENREKIRSKKLARTKRLVNKAAKALAK